MKIRRLVSRTLEHVLRQTSIVSRWVAGAGGFLIVELRVNTSATHTVPLKPALHYHAYL